MDPKSINESELSPAELQKAIDEQAKSIGKQTENSTSVQVKAKPPKEQPKESVEPAAVTSMTANPPAKDSGADKVAVKVTKTKKAPSQTTPESADKPTAIEVKISKSSTTIQKEVVPEVKIESSPKIQTHTAKMLKPPGDDDKPTDSDPSSTKTKPEVTATETNTADGSSSANVEPETDTETPPEQPSEDTPAETVEKTKDQKAGSKSNHETPVEKPNNQTVKGSGDADGSSVSAYTNTDIDNLARQIGGGSGPKTPLEEAAAEQKNLKTFDTNQYHLPIRPSRHHSGGKDTLYYFIVVAVTVLAVAYITNRLELVDIPFLRDI